MLELGKKIKALRQKRGWSQEDVAKQLDISIAAFSKIETDVTDLNTGRLLQLAQIFEISLAQLILPDGDTSPEYIDQLAIAQETIKEQTAKIVHLQEYVITLYEQLYKLKSS